MEINQISENKENISNNNQKLNIFKKAKIPYNFLTINYVPKNNEPKNNMMVKSFEKLDEHNEEAITNNNININNNNLNIINNNLIEKSIEEDLDIELKSVSKIIPINHFINIDDLSSPKISPLQKEK